MVTLNFLSLQSCVVAIICLLRNLSNDSTWAFYPDLCQKLANSIKEVVVAERLLTSVVTFWVVSPQHNPQDSVGLMGLRIQSYLWLRFITAKQNKTSKGGKMHAVKSRGNQAQASKNSFPVESHRMCFISPLLNCDTVCEMWSARDTH